MRARAGLSALTLLGLALAVGCGSCATDEPEFEFVVRVIGQRSVLNQFEISVPEFRVDTEPYIPGNGLWGRSFRRVARFAEHREKWYPLMVEETGNILPIRPFVCGELAQQIDVSEAKLTETHDYFLSEDGVLHAGTDLDRILRYACVADEGDDGTGYSTYSATPSLCGTDERRSTVVVQRADEAVGAQSCGGLFRPGDQLVALQLVFKLSDAFLTINLAERFAPEGAAYPRRIEYPSTSCPDCAFVVMSPWSDLKRTVHVPSMGHLTYDGIEFVENGKMRGTVEMVLDTSQAGVVPESSLTLRGTFELPLLRLPVQPGK